jgi:hypothetical protein
MRRSPLLIGLGLVALLLNVVHRRVVAPRPRRPVAKGDSAYLIPISPDIRIDVRAG